MMHHRLEPRQGVQICMPEFSVIALLLSIFYWRKHKMVIHYNTLPRYLRGLGRLLCISPEDIVSALSNMIHLPVDKITHAEGLPNYSYLHLKTMETVTKIANELIPEVRKYSWSKCLEKLLDEKPSLAYTAKYLSQYQLFTHIMPMVACHETIHGPEKYVVVWDPGWPPEWNNLLRCNLGSIKFEFFRWPRWYLLFTGLVTRIILFLNLLAIMVTYIARRGVTLKPISKERAKIITEFIDPKRLNNTPYDADYWIDGQNIRKNDILFFLTNNQKRILTKDGYALADIKKLFQQKGYKLAILDDLPYTLSALAFFLSLYFGIARDFFILNSPVLARTFLKAWTEYLEFLTIFLHCSSNTLIYLTFPNGHTSVRYDAAVLTALCRKNSIKSVGCQTRTIYANKFEDCFDCFDVYLSWGRSWDQISDERMLFIDKIITTGCIYLDSLLQNSAKHPNRNGISQHKESLTVSIFPSDISDDHHYTKNYTESLLTNCLELARAFPNFIFRVKSKDPKYTEILLADRDFREIYYSKLSDNFSFVNNLQYNYAEILFSSDIVIAIAFTTPGFEGLILGKRAIYYSNLGCGGQPFQHLPFFVANTGEELKDLFNKAIEDYRTYPETNSSEIDKLDPFRDGQALKRINHSLFAEIK